MSDERHTEMAQDWLHGAMKKWDELSDQGKYEVVNQADCHLQEILGIGRDNVDASVSDSGRLTYMEKGVIEANNEDSNHVSMEPLDIVKEVEEDMGFEVESEIRFDERENFQYVRLEKYFDEYHGYGQDISIRHDIDNSEFVFRREIKQCFNWFQKKAIEEGYNDDRPVCSNFYCGNWADQCEKH